MFTLIVLLQAAVNSPDVAREVLGLIALGFAAFSIPAATIWFVRLLLMVKKTAETTETVLIGPTGLVKEIERIRTKVHSSANLTQAMVSEVASVKEDIKDIKKELRERRND